MSDQSIQHPLRTSLRSNGEMRGASSLVLRFFQFVEQANARRIQRRQLLTLDTRMLRDVGLTQADLDQEARKPIWRA